MNSKDLFCDRNSHLLIANIILIDGRRKSFGWDSLLPGEDRFLPFCS